MLALCRWIAEYYVVPLGVVMRTRAARGAHVARRAGAEPSQTRRVARIAQRAAVAPRSATTLFARAPAAARALRAARVARRPRGGRASRRAAAVLAVGAEELVDARARRDRATRSSRAIRSATRDVKRAGAARAVGARSATRSTRLARGERRARSSCCTASPAAARRSSTSSCCDASCSSAGKTAIVLVPEIALTPQTVDRFRAVFGDEIAVLHSALSDGERYDAWLALREGEKRIAVGARSAIFAPLDEPRRDRRRRGARGELQAGRDAALSRARGRDRARARRGRGRRARQRDAEPRELVECGEREVHAALAAASASAGEAAAASTSSIAARRTSSTPTSARPTTGCALVDQRGARDARSSDRLQKKEQSILLLNRRGYASFVQCGDVRRRRDLPELLDQPHVPSHARAARLPLLPARRAAARARVRGAAGVVLRQRGLGTQQVERLLAERFPTARIARMDVDTTSGKWAHAEILDRVGARRGRHPARHADDREGARLSERDAGRRDRRGRRHQPAGLPRVGAVLSAPEPGGGARGARAEGRARCSSRRACPTHHAVRCAVTHDYHAFVRRGARRARRLRRIRRTAPRERGRSAARPRRRRRSLAMQAPTWLHALLAQASDAGHDGHRAGAVSGGAHQEPLALARADQGRSTPAS